MIGELWYLPGSPWSLRARWALALCELPLSKRPYRPVLDEPRLWARLGFPLRNALPLTVPVLFVRDGPALRHGIDIAKWAAQHCGNETLFPRGQDVASTDLCDKAQTVMAYLRTVKMKAFSQDLRGVQALFFPRFLRNRWFSDHLARLSTKLFFRKYKAPPRHDVVRALRCFADTLQSSPSDYLLGGEAISYADIAVATSLLFAIPQDISVGMWGRVEEEEEFFNDFGDLVSWRQRMFSELPFDQAEAFSFRSARSPPK